jgi:hypothetical protein
VAANVRKCKAKGLSPSTVIVLLGVYWLAATKPIAPRRVHGLTSDGTNYYASLHLKSGTAQLAARDAVSLFLRRFLRRRD